MDLEKWITIKRNVKAAPNIDHTGVTLDNLREIIVIVNDMKTLLKVIYDHPYTADTLKEEIGMLINKYFDNTRR